MLELILVLVILAAILWGVTQLPLDPTMAQIIRVVCIVVAVIYVASFLLGMAPGLNWPFPRRVIQ